MTDDALDSSCACIYLFMRQRARSISAVPRAVCDIVLDLRTVHCDGPQGKGAYYPSPDDSAPDDTSAQLNTHNIKLRDVYYPWHPWYGRSVVIHNAFVRHGQAVLRCTLEHEERSRALDIPQWMFDRALCCMMPMAEGPWVSWEALQDLQTLLYHQSSTRDVGVLQEQHRSSPAEGDADATSTQSSLRTVGVIAAASSTAHLADPASGHPRGYHTAPDTSATPGSERPRHQRPGGRR